MATISPSLIVIYSVSENPIKNRHSISNYFKVSSYNIRWNKNFELNNKKKTPPSYSALLFPMNLPPPPLPFSFLIYPPSDPPLIFIFICYFFTDQKSLTLTTTKKINYPKLPKRNPKNFTSINLFLNQGLFSYQNQ